MYAIELESEEHVLLEQLLQSALAALEVEITHTDHGEFRNLLRNRRRLLEALIAKAARHEPLAV